jgi:hypothetical protein
MKTLFLGILSDFTLWGGPQILAFIIPALSVLLWMSKRANTVYNTDTVEDSMPWYEIVLFIIGAFGAGFFGSIIISQFTPNWID